MTSAKTQAIREAVASALFADHADNPAEMQAHATTSLAWAAVAGLLDQDADIGFIDSVATEYGFGR